MAEIVRELEALDESGLRKAFRDAFSMTVGGLLRAAAVIRVWTARGLPLDDLGVPFGLMTALRYVADEQMLPEVIVKFFGVPAFRAVARLPLSEQRQIIDTEAVKVMEPDDPTQYRLCKVRTLRPAEVRQVFAPDHVRSDAEQRSLLSERRSRRPTKAPVPYVVDARARKLRVHEACEFSLIQLLDLCRQLGG